MYPLFLSSCLFPQDKWFPNVFNNKKCISHKLKDITRLNLFCVEETDSVSVILTFHNAMNEYYDIHMNIIETSTNIVKNRDYITYQLMISPGKKTILHALNEAVYRIFTACKKMCLLIS